MNQMSPYSGAARSFTTFIIIPAKQYLPIGKGIDELRAMKCVTVIAYRLVYAS